MSTTQQFTRLPSEMKADVQLHGTRFFQETMHLLAKSSTGKVLEHGGASYESATCTGCCIPIRVVHISSSIIAECAWVKST